MWNQRDLARAGIGVLKSRVKSPWETPSKYAFASLETSGPKILRSKSEIDSMTMSALGPSKVGAESNQQAREKGAEQ